MSLHLCVSAVLMIEWMTCARNMRRKSWAKVPTIKWDTEKKVFIYIECRTDNSMHKNETCSFSRWLLLAYTMHSTVYTTPRSINSTASIHSNCCNNNVAPNTSGTLHEVKEKIRPANGENVLLLQNSIVIHLKIRYSTMDFIERSLARSTTSLCPCPFACNAILPLSIKFTICS